MKVPTDSFKTFHAQTKVFLWSFHKKTRASAILELFLADGAMAKETGVQLEFTGNPITQHQEVSSAYFAVRFGLSTDRELGRFKNKLGRG